MKMIMIRNIVNKVFRKVFRGGYYDGNEYINYLRKCGVKVGKTVHFTIVIMFLLIHKIHI